MHLQNFRKMAILLDILSMSKCTSSKSVNSWVNCGYKTKKGSLHI